jgi:capsular polysaccharide biosynthesis protein
MSPAILPAPRRGDLDQDAYAWPDMGVAVIPGGRVLQDAGWVVGRGDEFLWNFSQLEVLRQLRVYHLIKGRRARRLAGRTLHLASNWAERNFFHWMIEAIPKAEIFRRAGYRWEEVDHVLLPAFRSATTDAVEKAAGVPPEKVIRLEEHHHFECDELLVPGPATSQHVVPPWVVEWHRTLFPVAEKKADLRLYLLRRGNRRVKEEAEIEMRLKAEGFVEAVQEDWGQLRAQLAAATHVVAVHGAAMTNLVYLRQGARVLELVPSHHPFRYYRTLCAALECPHGYLPDRSLGIRLNRHADYVPRDFSVSLAAFDEALKRLLADARVQPSR